MVKITQKLSLQRQLLLTYFYQFFNSQPMKMLSALSGNIACFHWGNMQVEIIDLLRAPIWGDLCMTNGRACIEGVGFTLASRGDRAGSGSGRWRLR
jgi:hypothetical protein